MLFFTLRKVEKGRGKRGEREEKRGKGMFQLRKYFRVPN
jgi:hypothetical protein